MKHPHTHYTGKEEGHIPLVSTHQPIHHMTQASNVKLMQEINMNNYLSCSDAVIGQNYR